MRALVTGATGFIGRRLLAKLDRPVVLTRDPHRARALLGPDLSLFAWDPAGGPPPAEAFRGIEVVFNLAGESVGEKRWTRKRKAAIRRSRVSGTHNLVGAIEGLREKPRVLVSVSAVGYYGDRGDEPLDESAPPGSDFLAEVCGAWEAEASRAAGLGLRVVTPRLGVVLGPDGGALKKMLLPFKLGLGGRLGSGTQWMPWVHLDDAVGLLLHGARTSGLSGPVNAVAPAAVTNREFTKTLGAVLGRPTILPMPGFMLRIVVGEFAKVLLSSQRVVPRAAEKSGYTFAYPRLEGALRAVLA
ncbi:MAG TPA: TIGR01777 family oxidoreductase [Planctomycetota bacterium]|jgi:hypothetical protein